MKHSILLKNRLAIVIGAAVLLLAFTISTIFSPGASASTRFHLKDKKDAPKAVTVFGTVVGIKGDTLLLSNPKHSKKLISIKITDDTLIFNKITKKKMDLKDLKPKTSVVVEGHLNKNGSITAKGVFIIKVEKKAVEKKLAEKKKLEELKKLAEKKKLEELKKLAEKKKLEELAKIKKEAK